jgi:iron-sulfur cluster assembly protein
LIALTPRAVQEIRRIISDQKLPENTALRVGVKGGGCSGFSYQLGFDDQVGEIDQVTEFEGVKVVCDPKSFLYLNGTQIDFEDNLMGRGFKFGNPNAAKSCGCGESFSV